MLHLEAVRFRVVSAHRQQLGDAALCSLSRDVSDEIDRERDRLSDACMWQPSRPETTQCASRVSACSAELLWIVVILPRCPVLSA